MLHEHGGSAGHAVSRLFLSLGPLRCRSCLTWRPSRMGGISSRAAGEERAMRWSMVGLSYSIWRRFPDVPVPTCMTCLLPTVSILPFQL